MNYWRSTRLRMATVMPGVVATVALLYLVNPWLNPDGALQNLTTWVFWIASIALVIVLYVDRKDAPESDAVEIEGPAFARFLFSNKRAGLVWLPIRLFVGFSWLESGWGKVNNPAWTDGGTLGAPWKPGALIAPHLRQPQTS